MRFSLGLRCDANAGIKYVFRPLAARNACASQLLEPCALLGTGGKLQLPGFGVEMAVKNMEYSALDDSKVSAQLLAADNCQTMVITHGLTNPAISEEVILPACQMSSRGVFLEALHG